MVKLIHLAALALPIVSISAAPIPNPGAGLPWPDFSADHLEQILQAWRRRASIPGGGHKTAAEENILDPNSAWFKGCKQHVLEEYGETIWFIDDDEEKDHFLTQYCEEAAHGYLKGHPLSKDGKAGILTRLEEKSDELVEKVGKGINAMNLGKEKPVFGAFPAVRGVASPGMLPI